MYNHSKNGKKHNSKDNQLPVSTADEWFAKEGLNDWPLPVASEGELDIEDMLEYKIDTKESLLDDLKTNACILYTEDKPCCKLYAIYFVWNFHQMVWKIEFLSLPVGLTLTPLNCVVFVIFVSTVTKTLQMKWLPH